MNCKFCNSDLANTNVMPLTDTASIYSLFCLPCKANYKLDNHNNLIFIVLDYKSCRLLMFLYEHEKPECILQVGTKNFIQLPVSTINLQLNDIYDKIDNILPFT